MKILIVSGTFPPRKFGGVTAVSYNIGKKLSERGHEVTVYTTDVGDTPSSRLPQGIKSKNGMKVYYFRNASNFLAFKYRLFLPLSMVFAIRKNIKNFDIVHINEYRSFLNLIIMYYCKKNNVPYVLQAHGSHSLASSRVGLRELYDWLFGYRVIDNATKIIALNKTEADKYEFFTSKEKIEIVPNGIDFSNYKVPEKGKFKGKYSISDDEKIVLYLGRIHQSKGIELLVNAFGSLVNDMDNVRLILAGPDDGYKTQLKKMITDSGFGDKVIFTGYISNEEKMSAFVDSDVFVTPKFTGFPITFLEACICGVPIITTNKGDELGWINNLVGFVVDFNEESLRNSILKVLRDDELSKRFSEGGRRLVKERFNWDSVVQGIEAIYNDNLKN